MTTWLAATRLRAQILIERQRYEFKNRRRFSEFDAQARFRTLLVSLPDRIPQSQIEAFFLFANRARRTFGTSIREVGLQDFLTKTNLPKDADIVAFQSDYSLDQTLLEKVKEVVRRWHPRAKLVYLDYFAPTDLRFAELLDESISWYVKKNILRDLKRYDVPNFGDTYLMDYYGRKYGLDHVITCHRVSSGFLSKLIVAPSFLSAADFARFFHGPAPTQANRGIDLHVRFDRVGSPWYERMRTDAMQAINRIKVEERTKFERAPRHVFLAELRRSKICFSPYGYGEVCWRDFEAAMMGAVILKPTMNEVLTEPDFYRAWETYAPVDRDLSNLSAVVDALLADKELREQLSRNAYYNCQRYLAGDDFLVKMKPLLAR